MLKAYKVGFRFDTDKKEIMRYTIVEAKNSVYAEECVYRVLRDFGHVTDTEVYSSELISDGGRRYNGCKS